MVDFDALWLWQPKQTYAYRFTPRGKYFKFYSGQI